jgi:hypothetical protein
MVYNAFLKSVNPNIEEEVVIVINGIELVGFLSYCPYAVEVEKTYPISIEITVLDEFEIRKADLSVREMQRLNQGFAYIIKGILKTGGVIDSVIEIQDEILVDYAYLYDEFVEFKVDRLSVNFL